MRTKARKLIWSAPLVAVFAVVGALALFATLAPDEAAAQTLAAPGQVQNVTLESTGPTSIKLAWDPPTEGGRPTAYRIDVSDDGLTWELLAGSWPSQNDDYDHTGLSARETKHYRIFAHNTSGSRIGPVAFPMPTWATTDASTAPGNPMDVTATKGVSVRPPAPNADTRTKITVRWDEPDAPPGTSIHQYKIAYAVDPEDLGLYDQVQTLDVVNNPDEADDDHVFCGYTATNDGRDCKYTFKKLLEHQTWHFQVYALNEDAMGDVGTSQASDSKSAPTDDGLLPAAPTDLWAAVNVSTKAIWVHWDEPKDPAGAPVNGYLVQGRPITDEFGDVVDLVNVDTDVGWGNDPSNAIIHHSGTTSDLLLTEHQVELRRAARVAWDRDSAIKVDDEGLGTVSDLEGLVPNFDTYFANLQWEFRVFALNRVWERTVKDVPVRYDAVLKDEMPDVSNDSASIHVSLNDLELSDRTTTIEPEVSVTIADADADADAAAVAAVAAVRKAYAGLSIPSVDITNTAVTREPRVVITHTSLTVTEQAGGTGMDQHYAVVLTTKPTTTVTVTITGHGGDTGLTVEPSTLTFSDTNWWQGQLVTVTAENESTNDAVDPDDVTLTHAATGAPEYVDVEIDDVTVSIKDDDTQPPDDADGPVALEEGSVSTPRLSITPAAAAFARPETGTPEREAQVTYTVTFTVDSANPLATDDEVVVTVPVPAGYTVVDDADNPVVDDADNPVSSRTFTIDQDTSTGPLGTFTLRADMAVNIASTQVDLQKLPDDLDAMKDANTDGGRTKVDLKWDETYSGSGDKLDDRVYATAYRIQWSTNPDASEWELLADVKVSACNAARECSYSHRGQYAGEEYSYRIFAKNAEERMGTAAVNTVVYSWSESSEATTTNAEKPGSPRDLRAVRSQSNGHTEIDLSWKPPLVDDDGVGEGDGFGVIVKYVIEKSADRSTTWEPLVTLNTEKACSAISGNGATHKTKAGLKPISGCTYTHTGLMPGQTLRYRVATVNIGIPEKTSDWSDTATLTTQKSTQPDRPEGLVAEAMGRSMINLMWNVQSRTPPAAPVIAYIIQYLDDDDVWMDAARIMDADAADNENGLVRTIHTDAGLAGETSRTYRVLAQNMPEVDVYAVSAESERAMATTAVAVAPDAPTGVEAMTVSDTEITVTWGAPDDNGAAITSYMVERGVMGADSTMTWTAVEPAHTDTMYMDMGLMPKTTYYYRVNAMNSVGTGEMSDGTASAMTYRTNTAPMAVGTIADMTLKAGQMSSGMDVSGYFNDADMDDTLTYMASSDMTTYATVAVSGSMVTITGVAAGMATITVTATDMGVGAGMMNPMTATQTIMVTVEAADTDTSLQDVPDSDISVTNNANSSITVSWMGGDNADSFIVVAAELDSDPFTYERANVAGDAAKMTTITGLNSGSSYIIIVIALQGTSFQYGVLPSVTAN